MSNESLLPNKTLRNEAENNGNLNPILLLVLILLLGAALRFYNLGVESYWIDEMTTVIEGQQSAQQLLVSGKLYQPPAYYLPFHFWEKIFGLNEVGTRSFSALAGVGSIALLYLIGQELFGRPIGLLGAFFMAISQFQIYYSQQARFYSFFEFFTLLSFLFFILALRNKTKVYFIFYVLAAILMVYSHTYGVFVLVAQGVFFILHWGKYRDMLAIWFVCQLLIFIAIIPYLYPLIFGDSSGAAGAVDANIGGLSAPLLSDPLRSIYRFIMPARGERSWGSMLVNYAIALGFFTISISIYIVRTGMRNLLVEIKGWVASMQKNIPSIKSKLVLVSCWLLFPIMMPYILSIVVRPMYLDRYLIGAAPALYLLLALSVFSIRKVVPILVWLGVLIIMIAPSLGYYYVVDIHEQWREAATYVSENSEPNDVIIVAPSQALNIEQRTFSWYYQGTLDQYGLGNSLLDSGAISNALKQPISGHNRLWLIMRNNENGSAERYKMFFLNPDRLDMRLVKEYQVIGISIYLFDLLK